MDKFNKSQLLVLLVLTLLLFITPFLPSSLKPTYLYFIFNLLIIALGAEAGLLSAFPWPLEDKKTSASASASVITIPEKKEASTSAGGSGSAFSELSEKKPNLVPEKFENQVKTCASMPSLFSIGVAEEEEAETMEEEVEAEDEVGQELSAKAEAFIGNFYKQLKMQRE